MSLFVGRLPISNFDDRDLEDIFYKYGRITKCQLKKGSRFSFGFVDFEDPEDAYDAIRDVDGLDIDGTRIVVEKVKGAPRRENDTTCYNCGEEGHWARDCRRRSTGRDRGRYRSRSRSSDRYSYRRTHSYQRDRSYSRSRSPYDRRGRSRSPRRGSRSSRRNSRSPYRDISRASSRDRRHESPKREEQGIEQYQQAQVIGEPQNEQQPVEQQPVDSQPEPSEPQPSEPTELQQTSAVN